jgi:hypothetical protein
MKNRMYARLAGRVVLSGSLAMLVFAVPAEAMQEPAAEPPMVMPEPPSLAEIARLEQERRRELRRSPSKVYSDKDVKRASPGQEFPTTQPAPPSSTPVPDAPAPAAGQPDLASKGEEFWKNRMTQAREEVRRNEVFAEALQSRINALTTDFVRVEPYQRAGISEDRAKALAEYERVKAEIVRGKQAVLDIEEEARKAGVPAGWIR